MKNNTKLQKSKDLVATPGKKVPIKQLREEFIKNLVLAILQGGGHSTKQIHKEINAVRKVFDQILKQEREETLKEVNGILTKYFKGLKVSKEVWEAAGKIEEKLDTLKEK